MKVSKRQGGEASGGDQALSELVELVRTTYSETMPLGDVRGLANLEHGLHPPRPRLRLSSLMRRRGVLAGALAIFAVTAGGFLAYRKFDHVTYEVTNGAVGPEGFVRATTADTTILFSEGSEIRLDESARARVDGLTSDGGHVILESGSVHARIVPRKRARWFVEAGPYTIHVTGTAFNVKWSWADERLELRMDHGSVIVTGPLAPSGVTLTAGMHLVANARTGLAIGGVPQAATGGGHDAAAGGGAVQSATANLSPPVDEEDSAQALAEDGTLDDSASAVGDEEPAAPADNRPAALERRQPSTRRRVVAVNGGGQENRRGVSGGDRPVALANPVPPAPPSWTGAGAGSGARERPPSEPWAAPDHWDRQLARGDVQGILDDAAARGVDRVLAIASGRELSALADAARYGHQPVLARRVLLSVRERFPRSAESRDAAFFLGGLAEDAGGAGGPAAALDWYELYLSESGRGRYASQALGRRMVMIQKLKGGEAARPVAVDYLERFPGGPYASAARKLVRAP